MLLLTIYTRIDWKMAIQPGKQTLAVNDDWKFGEINILFISSAPNDRIIPQTLEVYKVPCQDSGLTMLNNNDDAKATRIVKA